MEPSTDAGALIAQAHRKLKDANAREKVNAVELAKLAALEAVALATMAQAQATLSMVEATFAGSPREQAPRGHD